AQHPVELDLVREVHRRAHRDLMLRARALDRLMHEIETARIASQLDAQKGVRAVQPPPVRQRGVGGDLDAVALAVELVAEEKRHDRARSPKTGLGERRLRLEREEV